MITYKYYKFPNKDTVPALWPNGVNVYEIGRIFKTRPVLNHLNLEVSPGTFLEGWHVNVCYEGDIDLSFLQEYEINVNKPVCKWLGQ